MSITSDIQSAFREYANRHVKDNDRVQTLLHTADDLLPDFIRKNFDDEFTSLYAVKDKSLLKDYTERIVLDHVLKDEDSSINDVGYVATLTLYRRFMKSQTYGELTQQSDNGIAAEPSHKEKKLASKLVEGAIIQEEHCTGHERNREAREACIAYFRTLHHGHVVCECCGFDFEKAYGEMGKDFIEVHHRKPISQRGGEYNVVPEKDLVPLCSNCHSMIHRMPQENGECMSVDTLKKLYIGKVYTDE